MKIERRIAHTRERIAKWDKEADEVEASWTGGPDYKKFCQGMAEAARAKSAELEAKLKQLQGQPSVIWDEKLVNSLGGINWRGSIIGVQDLP